MRRLFFAIACALLQTLAIHAQDVAADAKPTITAPVETKPLAELSAGDAVVLGLVEGVTEYLPVSSTGHLIIANKLLNLNSDVPLTNAHGEPVWLKKPSTKHPEGVPLTPKLAADTFVVVIQFGAIAAVAYLYWRQIRSICLGLVGRDPAGLRSARNLGIAFLPAAVLGFLLHDKIESLFSVAAVVTAQVSGAILMILAEKWRKRQTLTRTSRNVSELSGPESFGIGALQCLALWPGMSRSMTTIVGGYFAGLSPQRSAEFSFLLGLVTLTAATGYKSFQSGSAMLQVFGWRSILIGCFVAAVTAAFSVRFLVNYLTRHGLFAFAIYRLVLAAILGVMLYRGVL
ncbi:MAG: undecaprenyl-diphosphate phosphatase [Nibricoccus sp.]